MAAQNFFLGLKRGDNLNPDNVVAGQATVGTAVDVEVRIQINDGSTATGITRKDVIEKLLIIMNFIESGNPSNAGANLPGL